MKYSPILAVLLLSACAGHPVATTSAPPPTATAPPAPTSQPSILAQVQGVCTDILPLASLVPPVGIYATAFCDADNLANRVLTPADLAWISNIGGELKGNAMPAPIQIAH